MATMDFTTKPLVPDNTEELELLAAVFVTKNTIIQYMSSNYPV
jgi:hypothetical protein